MDFNEYQEKSRKTALFLDKVKEKFGEKVENFEDIISIGYIGLGLGEVGEIQNKLKKLIRDKAGEWAEDDKKQILDEASDVLWYLARLAYNFGFTLEQAAEHNIEKLYSRLERGKIRGSGDNR